MAEVNVTEQLMYNTVRIETMSGSSGTGFFYNFEINNNIVPVLVTNKHVINNNTNEVVKFRLHLKKDGILSTKKYELTLETDWLFHPKLDLCITFMNPIFKEVKIRTNSEVYCTTISNDIIPTKKQLADLSALEEIVMVGYPIGLWDSVNNLPIFRKGFTASHPAYDFNQTGIALADIAAFPGSSGSPIFILNQQGYTDNKGNIHLGTSRLLFLGIIYAVPTLNIQGVITEISIPLTTHLVSNLDIMTNLGYYIKSNQLNYFRKIIRERLNKENNLN